MIGPPTLIIRMNEGLNTAGCQSQDRHCADLRGMCVVQAGRQRMVQMQQAEMSKAQAAQAKNELEAYIISTQGRLGGDEEVQAVTTDKQREAFQTELSEVEEWLYDQGEHEQASVFRCVGETKQMKASRKIKQKNHADETKRAHSYRSCCTG